MPEARLEDSGSGLAPTGEGWFVVNVRDAEWETTDEFGSGCVFESGDAWFRQLGINVAVLLRASRTAATTPSRYRRRFSCCPASASCSSTARSGRCVSGTSPTAHREPSTSSSAQARGPCVILMTGARSDDEKLFYPFSELAARYGASAATDTANPREAYAGTAPSRKEKPPHWDRLPWT